MTAYAHHFHKSEAKMKGKLELGLRGVILALVMDCLAVC